MAEPLKLWKRRRRAMVMAALGLARWRLIKHRNKRMLDVPKLCRVLLMGAALARRHPTEHQRMLELLKLCRRRRVLVMLLVLVLDAALADQRRIQHRSKRMLGVVKLSRHSKALVLAAAVTLAV